MGCGGATVLRGLTNSPRIMIFNDHGTSNLASCSPIYFVGTSDSVALFERCDVETSLKSSFTF